MTTARAAVTIGADTDFRIQEITLDDLQADELLVQIEASGVCQTDVAAKHMLPTPSVLGHEGVGIVSEIGTDVVGVNVGDRVLMSYPSCAKCPMCDAGAPYICDHAVELSFGGCREDGSRPVSLDGDSIASAFFQQSSFSSHAITTQRNIVVVPGDQDPAILAALPCGIQTGAGSILNSFDVQAGEGLVVYGAGAVGLSAIMAGALVSASPLVAVDINDSRLQLAEDLGATHVVNAAHDDAVKRILEWAPRGVPYVFDTSGSVQAFEAGIENLCMGGTFGYVSPPLEGAAFPFSFETAMMRAANIRSIIQGSAVPQQFLPFLLKLQQEGRFPFQRLINTYAFEDINQAFADAASGETVKPVLLM